jgi:hypothetical protein
MSPRARQVISVVALFGVLLAGCGPVWVSNPLLGPQKPCLNQTSVTLGYPCRTEPEPDPNTPHGRDWGNPADHKRDAEN